MLCILSRKRVSLLASFERNNMKQIKLSHTNTLGDVSKQLLKWNPILWKLLLLVLITQNYNRILTFQSPLLD